MQQESDYLENIQQIKDILKGNISTVIDHLKGLIVGGFTEMEDTDRPFGQTIEEIISDKVKEYSYPVCFNFPAGHQDINYTLTLGAIHKLTVTGNGGTLELRRSS